MLLARYLEAKANEITFDCNPHGKPSLKNPAQPDFHFNTSHSGDYAVFAFTHIGPVGVDIECIRNDRRATKRLPAAISRVANTSIYIAAGARTPARLFRILDAQEHSSKRVRWTFFRARPIRSLAHRTARAQHRGRRRRSGGFGGWLRCQQFPGYTGALAVQAASCVARFWKLELLTTENTE